MPEEKTSHRFLLETCSQQLHREEAIRRRRELLERESTKPPVMHFGSTSSLHRSTTPTPTPTSSNNTNHYPNKKVKSVSPVPRPVPTPSSNRPVRRSRSAPPSAAASTVRSRPHSRESSRRLPLPPGAKITTRLISIPRAKSYRPSPATSRVASPAPPVQGTETNGAKGPQKRSRSGSISRANSRSKQRRFSLPQKSDSIPNEKKAPFMSSQSPTRNASPFKQPTSRTPTPPPPISRSVQEQSGNNVHIPVIVLAPVLRAEERSESLHPVSPFALPSTAERKIKEGKIEPEESQHNQEQEEQEEEEELTTFRISEFRMPRTPQRRSSLTANSLPQITTSTGKYSQERQRTEEEEKEEANQSSCVKDVSVMSHTVEEEAKRLDSVEDEYVRLSTNLDDEEAMLSHEKGKETECNVNECENEEVDKSLPVLAENCGAQFSSPPAGTLMTADVIGTAEQEETAVSAYSSHAYECSSTTTESPQKEIEAIGGRQLLFDAEEETPSDDKKDEEEEEEEKEEETKEEEVKIHLQKLVAYECVEPTVLTNIESCATSQNTFKDCISAPSSSPALQLPDAYRQLEATRREMATSSVYQRESLAAAAATIAAVRRAEGRLSENRRDSLVLVTGDLPTVYTPAIQEPHTPPPALKVQISHSSLSRTPPPKSQNTFISCDVSPIPRPVTLRSQISSTSRQGGVKESVSLSLSPQEGRSTPYPHASLTNVSKEIDEEIADNEENQTENVMDTSAHNTTARSRSRSTCGRKSVVERLMESCPSDVREEAEQLIAADMVTASTPLRNMGSGQISEILTDTSSISQRVAARPRKYYYDYTYWERYLHDSTKKSLQKPKRRSSKKAKKSSSQEVKPDRERDDVHIELNVGHETKRRTTNTTASTDTATVATTVQGTRNSTPKMPRLTPTSSSQSSKKRNSTSVQRSLRNSISRKNRDRIILQRRRMSRRHARRK
ncbi:uncharacterized protein TM35_000172520 [Trypanosoma theileri]|uniref:Uncharacterized protein n=1 Tax=Trypanosoma theileri TaxID=67003 RepID=A0A1X0NW86_9TRYP|nr:uncharacterized protein TM35_000172520 [Trypanosoma theileri]ORC88380.1 hypothetical protein TM35_000172520 [Trypanosoma theileri]